MQSPITVYFHLGISKTGSTAIQYFLEKNTTALEQFGYYYPLDSQLENQNYRTSGNGYSMYLEILNKVVNQELLNESMTAYLSALYTQAQNKNCHTIILSSEAFSTLSANDFNAFIDSLPQEQFEYKFIFFVREPYEWAFSSWLQVVKREGLTTWLDQAVTSDMDFSLRPLFLMQRIQAKSLESVTTILNYDLCKTHVVESFLLGIGLQSEQIMHYVIEPKIVNRSITRLEFAMHYFINKYSAGDVALSEKLSELIIDHSLHELHDIFFFEDKYVKFLIYEYCEKNAFFMPNKTLQKEPIQYTTSQYTETDFLQSLEINEQYVIRYLSIVIEYYKNIFNSARELTLEKINYYNKSEYKKLVPNDFNVFVYLILNQDVLFSNLDPYKHYVEYGQYDKRVFNVLD